MREQSIVLGSNIEMVKNLFVHTQKALRDCWVRFRKEYLNQLSQMNGKQTSFSRDLVVEDILVLTKKLVTSLVVLQLVPTRLNSHDIPILLLPCIDNFVRSELLGVRTTL